MLLVEVFDIDNALVGCCGLGWSDNRQSVWLSGQTPANRERPTWRWRCHDDTHVRQRAGSAGVWFWIAIAALNSRRRSSEVYCT